MGFRKEGRALGVRWRGARVERKVEFVVEELEEIFRGGPFFRAARVQCGLYHVVVSSRLETYVGYLICNFKVPY